MALSFYDRFFVFINGAVDGEAASATLEYQGEYIPIATLLKDFAGVTPTPKMCKVSIEGFVPSAGFSVDAPKLFLAGSFVDVKLQYGGSGKAFKAKGIMQPPTLSSSATEASKISFSLICEAYAVE